MDLVEKREDFDMGTEIVEVGVLRFTESTATKSRYGEMPDDIRAFTAEEG